MASVEELTDPGFVTDLDALGLDELRGRREACQALEDAVSYIRRLAQGRLDIVRADLPAPGSVNDDAAMVAALVEVLADRGGGGSGRLPGSLEPGEMPPELVAELDLAMSGSEPDELAALEARMSSLRHRVHVVIDALNAEMVQRFSRSDAAGGPPQ